MFVRRNILIIDGQQILLTDFVCSVMVRLETGGYIKVRTGVRFSLEAEPGYGLWRERRARRNI